MISLEAARQRLLELLPAPGQETIPLAAAAGRWLAAPVTAATALPPFDNSAMDGYAVRAADVIGATSDHPVELTVVARVGAGETWHGTLPPGHAVRLFTGSPLPTGADAVVMQEDTQPGTSPDRVSVCDAVKPWENVRLQGEDVRPGTVLVEAGQRLNGPALGLLAATGLTSLTVGTRPVVGLLATGNELCLPGEPLRPGGIYESNRTMLAPLLESVGALPLIYPLVADTLAGTEAALSKAFAECPIVISTGGVSVGDFDHVKPALERIGGTLDFWQIAMKPGKPFVFGRKGDSLFFGLPGNPVSALVTFLLLVRPALIAWQGGRDLYLPQQPGVLAASITNRGDRRHFVRVTVTADGLVRPAGPQASHRLGSLPQANALLDVPPETSWPAGMAVSVHRWDWSA